MEKILVATDGSENSERAVLEAREYAECTNGKVTILTVISDPLVHYTVIGYDAVPVAGISKEEGQIILERALNLFDNFKGEVTIKTRKGDTADEILKEAEEGDYDLIIMGSKGLGAFSRTILGSISNKVLNHSGKNMMIIK